MYPSLKTWSCNKLKSHASLMFLVSQRSVTQRSPRRGQATLKIYECYLRERAVTHFRFPLHSKCPLCQQRLSVSFPYRAVVLRKSHTGIAKQRHNLQPYTTFILGVSKDNMFSFFRRFLHNIDPWSNSRGRFFRPQLKRWDSKTDYSLD